MISAIIPTNGKREEELKQIVKHLEQFGFGEIIIARDKGLRMYTRYATPAKYDIIYTQDDDCIVENIKELLDAHEDDVVVANIKKERKEYYDTYFNGKICLVGYGAVFNKKLIHNMDDMEKDELFFREADRAFTGRNKKKLILADEKIKDFPSAEVGMCKDEEHSRTLNIMYQRLCES